MSSAVRHFSLMVILITVFVLSVRRLNFMIQVPELPAFTYLVIYAFGGFLSAALALRFVFPMVSLEGRSFWSLLSAPISPKKVYLTKFVIAALVVFVLALLVSYFSNIPFMRLARRDTLLLIVGLVSAVWVTMSMVSLNLGFGGYFVNYQEKNPIRIASSQGATLTFLLNLVLLVVLISILVLPVSQYFESLLYFRAFSRKMFLIPGVVFSLVSLAAMTLGLLVGLRSLKRDAV